MPVNENIDNDIANPIDLFLHLKYANAKIKNSEGFGYWFFNEFITKKFVALLEEIESYKVIILQSNRTEIQRSYTDYDHLENTYSFANQIYRLQRLPPDKNLQRSINPISFINYCIQTLEIGETILFKRNADNSSSVYIKNGNTERLLADVGYGVSQILSFIFEIALQIAKLDNK